MNNYDFVILGAGLAGIHTAVELQATGAKVCVIDLYGTAAGASGTPLGLVNPATGRYATKTAGAEYGLPAIREHLNAVHSETGVSFFKETGVLRPALSDKIATRMKENTADPDWPGGWVKWISEYETKQIHPGLTVVDGAVWVPVGLSVDIASYLKSYATLLNDKGVKFITGHPIASAINTAADWTIQFQNNMDPVYSKSIIDCRGISTSDDRLWWPELKLHAVKGQVAVLSHDPELSFDHAVSALGYCSSLEKGKTVIGSTYEHSFDSDEPDDAGLEYLMDRLGQVLPELISSADVLSQWAGIRASSPDRKPYLGKHPSLEELYVFSGLGSKGLLYSAWGAKTLSDHIVNGTSIPPELDIDRFNK